jgi:hypothetical protein
MVTRLFLLSTTWFVLIIYDEYYLLLLLIIMMIIEYEGRRLRRTAWTGESADLFLEDDKRSTSLFIKDSDLKDGDLLVFEEGILPLRGMLNIQVFFWNDQPDFSSIETTISSTASGGAPPSDLEDPSALDIQCQLAYQKRLKCLILVGEMHVVANGQLHNLYEQTVQLLLHKYTTLQEQYPPLFQLEIPSSSSSSSSAGTENEKKLQRDEFEQHFLLRELRPDFLPGKCLWLYDTSTVSLGNTLLKKLSVKNLERGLIVQLLPNNMTQRILRQRTPSSSTTNTTITQPVLAPGSVRLWVQELINPLDCRNGHAIMEPQWPPIPITLNGGNAPTSGHLFRAIHEALPHIPMTDMHVYRYHIPNSEWVEMKKPGEVKETKGKQSPNLFNGPNPVREGMLFCVVDARKLGSSSMTTTSTTMTASNQPTLKLEISTAIDLYYQQQRAEANLMKKSGRKASSVFDQDGSGNKKSNTLKKPEYALTLHLDLDDWDED